MDFLQIFEREKKSLKKFFNQSFSLALPAISQETFTKLDRLGFDLHFLPAKQMAEEENFPGWQEKPAKNFYALLKKERLAKNSDFLPNKWVFIEKRNKPKKNFYWIAKDDLVVKIFRKFHFDLKKYCTKVNRQLYEDDFLIPLLKKNGFASRFSLSWYEIEERIIPEIANFLKIPREKIRLPRLIEWNFLANAFYPQWGETETWEWFMDRLDTGECLSGGSRSLGTFGWDPPDYWSTILGFRILIEV